ncbi:MAG: type IV pilus assembly protein PilM [Nitrospinae bacterium]|nr:type IV pilus assembly protein PilM [Nitrospinota bacterium]
MFFSSNQPLTGIDIGNSNIKLVKFNKKGSHYHLENFGILPLPTGLMDRGEIADPNELSTRIKALVKAEKLRGRKVITALSGDQVVIKKISLPVMSMEELEETILKEADQYLPFTIDECNIDYHIIKNPTEEEIKEYLENPPDGEEEDEGPQMELFLVAVHKEKAETMSTIFKNAGLDLAVIDVNIFSLENSFEANHVLHQDEVVALVDIGANVTGINILSNKVSSFTRDIPLAGDFFTDKISKDLGVDYEEANKLKFGISENGKDNEEVVKSVLEGVEEFSKELSGAFEYFSTAENKPVDKIYFAGGGLGLQGVEKIIGEKLNVAVDIIDPFRNIKINNKVFDPEYIRVYSPISAVATGLALREEFDR